MIMSRLISGLILLLIPFNVLSRENKPYSLRNKQRSFYFYWGYNRSYYSKTNLHFTGPNYDFTLYNLTGADRPSPVDLNYANPTRFTIPQFNYRIGYFLTKTLAVSIGMDHMKYVVNKNQQTTISGVVTEAASNVYAGSYLNKKVELKEDLLKFEHTNGFNLFSLDVEYLPNLFDLPKLKLAGYWNMGIGGIWIVTKTDVRVFGDGLDNDFHLSGYSLTSKTGPRIEYNNLIFLSGEIRGGYASLPSVLIKNSAPEIADHNLSFLEYYIVAGVNFRLGKREGKGE